MTNKEQYDNLCGIVVNSQKTVDALETIGLNVDCIENKNGVGDFLGKINDDAMKSIMSLLSFPDYNEDDIYVSIYSSCITENYDNLKEIWDEYGLK